MDPLASQAASTGSLRPALALDSSLAAVLSEGRVVAGEVLQTLDGRNLLLGIGRHRVPADSGVDLKPGDRFLAQVTKGEKGLVLNVRGRAGAAESKLLSALRTVVGQDRPIGEQLTELASRLRGALTGGASLDDSAAKLLRGLEEHVFRPGSNASELGRLLAKSGINFEALLLGEGRQGGALLLGATVSEFTKQLILNLQQFSSLGAGLGAGLLSKEQWKALEQNLAKDWLAANSTTMEGTVGGKSNSLQNAIAKRLGELSLQGPKAAQLQAAIGELGDVLSRLFGEGGDRTLVETHQKWLQQLRHSEALVANLKSKLLAALEQLPPGEARDAVAKTLAGIESEQLLNLARRELNEGWHMSLPIPDGERWATAQLFYHGHEGSTASGGEGEAMKRLSVAVDFSSLGPVRAEIGANSSTLALRLIVTRPEVLLELRSQLEELSTRLASSDRSPRISISLGSSEDTSLDSLSLEMRWLRDHRLMDLSG